MSVLVRPRHSRVLVKRDEAEAMSRGGIIIPDTAKDKQTKGEVLAVGPGRRTELGGFVPVVGIEPGDMVLFTKFAGDGFKIEGEEYFLVEDKDIIAVIGRAPDPEPRIRPIIAQDLATGDPIYDPAELAAG